MAAASGVGAVWWCPGGLLGAGGAVAESRVVPPVWRLPDWLGPEIHGKRPLKPQK